MTTIAPKSVNWLTMPPKSKSMDYKTELYKVWWSDIFDTQHPNKRLLATIIRDINYKVVAYINYSFIEAHANTFIVGDGAYNTYRAFCSAMGSAFSTLVPNRVPERVPDRVIARWDFIQAQWPALLQHLIILTNFLRITSGFSHKATLNSVYSSYDYCVKFMGADLVQLNECRHARTYFWSTIAPELMAYVWHPSRYTIWQAFD